MNQIFEYIYYRLNKGYFKWDGRRGSTALFGVTFVQLFWLLDIFLFVDKLLPFGTFPRDKNLMTTIFAVVFGVALYFNYRIHDGKYNTYKRRWASEAAFQRRLRGVFVIIAIVLPIVLAPIIINLMKQK